VTVRSRVLAAVTAAAAIAGVIAYVATRPASPQPQATVVTPAAAAPVVVVHPAAPGAPVRAVRQQPTPVAQLPPGGALGAAATVPNGSQRGPAPVNTSAPAAGLSAVPSVPSQGAAPTSALQALLNGIGPPAILGGFSVLETVAKLVNTLTGQG
jgi:hypothetical protein